jgi:hypothetical protein
VNAYPVIPSKARQSSFKVTKPWITLHSARDDDKGQQLAILNQLTLTNYELIDNLLFASLFQ